MEVNYINDYLKALTKYFKPIIISSGKIINNNDIELLIKKQELCCNQLWDDTPHEENESQPMLLTKEQIGELLSQDHVNLFDSDFDTLFQSNNRDSITDNRDALKKSLNALINTINDYFSDIDNDIVNTIINADTAAMPEANVRFMIDAANSTLLYINDVISKAKPAPKLLHYNNIYTPLQVEAMYKLLIDSSYIPSNTLKEDFIYYFSGIGNQPTDSLCWAATSLELAQFLKIFFSKETQVWKKAKCIFNVNNLAKIYNKGAFTPLGEKYEADFNEMLKIVKSI